MIFRISAFVKGLPLVWQAKIPNLFFGIQAVAEQVAGRSRRWRLLLIALVLVFFIAFWSAVRQLRR